MKATVYVCQVDHLGRLALPMEPRRALEMKDSDVLDINADGDNVVLRKCLPKCVFCSNEGRELGFHGNLVCRQCATVLRLRNPVS